MTEYMPEIEYRPIMIGDDVTITLKCIYWIQLGEFIGKAMDEARADNLSIPRGVTYFSNAMADTLMTQSSIKAFYAKTEEQRQEYMRNNHPLSFLFKDGNIPNPNDFMGGESDD